MCAFLHASRRSFRVVSKITLMNTVGRLWLQPLHIQLLSIHRHRARQHSASLERRKHYSLRKLSLVLASCTILCFLSSRLPHPRPERTNQRNQREKAAIDRPQHLRPVAPFGPFFSITFPSSNPILSTIVFDLLSHYLAGLAPTLYSAPCVLQPHRPDSPLSAHKSVWQSSRASPV